METFKEKFIGYIDVLGFKGMVEEAEKGEKISLKEILQVLERFDSKGDRDEFVQCGPITCPQSKYEHKDLDYRKTRISDGVVISTEISPAGVINCVDRCWRIVFNLMAKGVLCRGYLTRGSIYHTDDYVVGSGYHEAIFHEPTVSILGEGDEKGTPFVEVDKKVCTYIEKEGDKCVKEMFSRFVVQDNDFTALFPFNRLTQPFILSGLGTSFDPEKERKSNQQVRLMIKNITQKVMLFTNQSNPRAFKKTQHYIKSIE